MNCSAFIWDRLCKSLPFSLYHSQPYISAPDTPELVMTSPLLLLLLQLHLTYCFLALVPPPLTHRYDSTVFYVLPKQCVLSIPVTGITEGDAEVSVRGPLRRARGCGKKESLLFSSSRFGFWLWHNSHGHLDSATSFT